MRTLFGVGTPRGWAARWAYGISLRLQRIMEPVTRPLFLEALTHMMSDSIVRATITPTLWRPRQLARSPGC